MVIYREEDLLKITRTKPGLKFLRCFGHLIQKMNFSLVSLDQYSRFRSKLKYFDKVKELFNEYLFKYCADSLLEIEFYINNSTMLMNLRIENWKPFTNVEKVLFSNSTLDTQLISFNELFPKLRSLEFCNLHLRQNIRNFLTSGRCIAQHFTNLQHLSVIMSPSESFREDEVLAALKLNPKLQRLCLYFMSEMVDTPPVISPEFFPLLSEQAKCLETLQIKLNDCSPLLQLHDKIIRFERLKNLELHLNSFQRTPFPLKNPFQSDRLESFILMLPWPTENALEFIKFNQEITEMSFTNSKSLKRYHEE